MGAPREERQNRRRVLLEVIQDQPKNKAGALKPVTIESLEQY